MSLTSTEISELIKAGEADLVEFKREWFDLTNKEGKAKLARTVLALSNTVRPDAAGYLIVGVEDERRQGEIVGVLDPPDPDAISQILSEYIQPPANIECRHSVLAGKTISVLKVSWSAARPHHCLRQYENIVQPNQVYVRRDRTVGTATLPEIELMIRDKESRLGSVVSRVAIQCGFVSKSDTMGTGTLVARVTNVSTEPVGGVDVTFDVRHARNPELFERVRRLTNATLGPNSSRELELRLRDLNFWVASFNQTGQRSWYAPDLGRHAGDFWFDVILHVAYRDGDGFIRTIESRVAVDG
jgi:hypothetical protein